MVVFMRCPLPEILTFVSTPWMVRVEAGDGARGRMLGHVTGAATGDRSHLKAVQAAQAVIRSSAPGCELSVTTTVPLPVSNVVLA